MNGVSVNTSLTNVSIWCNSLTVWIHFELEPFENSVYNALILNDGYRIFSMSVQIKTMIENLWALGVRAGGVLLVHSSLRSLGTVEGGAETVVRVLLDVLGEQGTLLFPALSYATVGKMNPHFNVRNTPSCIGALPEYFRQRDGTIRSIHPTHSVSGIGKYASELLGEHQKDTTPCGIHSPFHKLPHYNGQILFIGCGLRPNTSMHAIEELVEPPYLYNDIIEYDITDAAGITSKMSVRSHNFNGWIQRYDRVAQVLDSDALRTGKVLNADCHFIETPALWSAVHRKLSEDALFFVDREQANWSG
jgi:aminoglycoside 3-N-acetyltransferase